MREPLLRYSLAYGQTTFRRTEQVETFTPLLAVDDLFCERDERVLFQNLSFRLAEGQVLQIKGGNGSGKRPCCGFCVD